jgi:hypothetical protein
MLLLLLLLGNTFVVLQHSASESSTECGLRTHLGTRKHRSNWLWGSLLRWPKMLSNVPSAQAILIRWLEALRSPWI